MHFTVYKTTNTANDRFYVGMHKTDTPLDGYLGSGTLLVQAIMKQGRSLFVKEILYDFDNSEDMRAKEAEIVDEAFVNDPYTYNLNIGGYGGWDFVNRTGAERRATPGWISPFAGKIHTAETIAALTSLRWVSKGVLSRRVLPEDVSGYIEEDWVEGRPDAISQVMMGNPSAEGWVWIHKNGEARFVQADAIPREWVLGRPGAPCEHLSKYHGQPHTEDSKRRISEGLKRTGFKPVRQDGFKGKQHTEEAKAKLREANQGRTHTVEATAKIGLTKVGRKQMHNPMSNENRYVKAEEAPTLLSSGWVYGWCDRK